MYGAAATWFKCVMNSSIPCVLVFLVSRADSSAVVRMERPRSHVGAMLESGTGGFVVVVASFSSGSGLDRLSLGLW